MEKRQSFSSPEYPVSDSTLVSFALNGDPDAFEELVQRYSDPLLKFIGSILRSSELYDQINDVWQHVLLQLYLSLPNLSLDVSLKPWLFRVAHNRCVDEIRKQRIRPVVYLSKMEQELDLENLSSPLALLTDTDPLPEEVAEQHDLAQRLQAAIDTLPPKMRTIVLLRYTQQLNFTEIGLLLKIPSTTAKTYFHRARLRLQAVLNSGGEILLLKDPLPEKGQFSCALEASMVPDAGYANHASETQA